MIVPHCNLRGRRRFLTSTAAAFLFFCQSFQAMAARGKVVKESNCKVLIQGGVDADVGDVVPVYRRGSSSLIVGRVRILKNDGVRATGRIVEPTSNCGASLGGRVGSRPMAQGQATGNASKKGPPPPLRTLLAAGPSFVTSTLKGISRAPVIENYPLVLASINASLESYPLMFGSSKNASSGNGLDFKTVLGLEGVLHYLSSMGEVRVTAPSPESSQEVVLGLGVNRMMFRGGALLRFPLWKGRLFLDGRSGFYSHRFTSTLTKLISTPEGEVNSIEISPLRDLDLSGPYALGGLQFQPVDNFRARLSVGTVFGASYRIDNRFADSKPGSPKVSSNISQPGLFILEANVNYLFSKVQLGLDISLESFSGAALFPDGEAQGNIAEVYSSYGVNLGFLL